MTYSTLEHGAVYFRPAALTDLDLIHAIEAASYPEDEAATREKLEFRLKHAPEYFLVAMASADGGTGEGAGSGGVSGIGGQGRQQAADKIVGYACGTCSPSSSLTHESMSTHEPGGCLLCIHSVCVASPHRRRGVASRLLNAYLAFVAASGPGLEEVRLVCKEALVPLYKGAGFRLLGPSPVVHGRDPWLEMALTLPGRGGDDGTA